MAVDVNIVPFIDLMSVLIIFLLITAVWAQVSMIQIGSSVYGKSNPDQETKVPPRAEIPFRVDIRDSGYRILIGRQLMSLPKVNGEFTTDRLLEELKKVKELYPEKVDVVVSMADELAYEHLIDGMDSLLTAGFPEISIATSEVE